MEQLLTEREQLEEGARAFRIADDRLKKWAKARPEKVLELGLWRIEKKKFSRGVRVEVKKERAA